MITLLTNLFFFITAIFQIVLMVPLIFGMVVCLAGFCVFGTACLFLAGDLHKIKPLWRDCFTKAVVLQKRQ